MAAAAILIIFLLLVAFVLLPLWFSLFDSLMFDALTPASIASGVGAWVGLIVTIYVAWMMTEVTLAADRL